MNAKIEAIKTLYSAGSRGLTPEQLQTLLKKVS